MKIAYLHRYAADLHDGSAVHVHALVEQLTARGHQLFCLAPYEIPGCTPWTEQDFRRRAGQLDVFYVRIHGSKSNDRLTALRRFGAQAVCVWEVNAPIEEKLLDGLSRWRLFRLNRRRRRFARAVDGAICVSAEMARYARDRLGITTTTVLPNGADPERFSPQRRQRQRYGKRFTVLWSGTGGYPWQAQKRVETLAEYLQRSGVDVQLALTAAGTSRPPLLYLGRQSFKEMPGTIASCDAGLCLYEDIEYFPQFYFSPLKLYEYMASAIPVIGQDIGQIREVLQSHDAGLLTDGTVEDLAHKILQLQADPGAAREMGNRGREAILESHSWAHVAQATEHFLQALRNSNREMARGPSC